MDQKLIETLSLTSKLETEDDFKIFSETLEKMVLSKNPVYIANMLACLNDDPPFIEAMDNIVSAAESFPDKEYVEVVINMTPKLQEKSIFWLNVLYSRMFNNPSCLKVYKEEYDRLEKNKQSDIKSYLWNIFLKNQPNQKNAVGYIIS